MKDYLDISARLNYVDINQPEGQKQPPEVFYKKGVLVNFAKFTGKHLRQSLFLIKEETLAQAFSCEFCEIYKNSFFTEHLWATASERTSDTESGTTKFIPFIIM